MKKLLLIQIMIAFHIWVYPQCTECEYEDGIIWVVVDKESAIMEYGKVFLDKDNRLVELFNIHKVNKFEQVYPASKNELLQRLYIIEFNGNTNDLYEELNRSFKTTFDRIIKIAKSKMVEVYDPSDGMWTLTLQDTTNWLWHLHKIKANLAWDITHGSENVKIALLDTWFDINHPDLSNKINPHYDPYTNQYFSSDCTENHHGTTVASFIAAETDGGGQLASIGFNCRIIPYKAIDFHYLRKAHHASMVMGADVLTSSAGPWPCDRPGDEQAELDSIAVKEILDNGTIIVMPAGNGNGGYKCGEASSGYTPFYSISPYYDERIIIVTSTNINHNHAHSTLVHSHFPEVDICAPGYCVMGATGTKTLVNGNCVDKEWPYYGCGTGTSLATPIVAGVCGLMKAVNPCIDPAEAQDIIKSTADPVNDAHLYPGKVGAGRINAYKAVKKAATRYVQNITYSGTQSITAHIIEVGSNVTSELPAGNVIVPSGSNVTFTGRHTIVLEPGFEVSSNGYFEVIVDANAVITCN